MNGTYILRCICEDTRISILEILLKDKELCVNDIVQKQGEIQPLVSHHLRALKKCGVVKAKNQGRNVIYSIANKRLANMITNIINTSKQIPDLCYNDDRQH